MLDGLMIFAEKRLKIIKFENERNRRSKVVIHYRLAADWFFSD